MSFTSNINFANFEVVTYNSFLKLVPNFISLDISKNSTGWVRSIDGIIDEGSFEIKADKYDLVKVRRDFRNFVIGLCGDRVVDYVFIEDNIGSINFDTARVLFQLNCITDDLNDMGLIKVNNIIREDNRVWKKNLKKAANYKATIKSSKDDKQVVRDALLLMGYGDGTTDHIKEDIYDAMGLAVGVIYSRFVVRETSSTRKLKTNINVGYKVKQFEGEYDAYDFANDLARKTGQTMVNLDYMNIKRDLAFNFKKEITSFEDENKIYVIKVLTCKIGVLAVKLKLDLNISESYLVVSKK